MRATRPYTYLGTVRGMCRRCRALVPCRVLEEGGAVYQERLCPACSRARPEPAEGSRALIADSVEWYLRMQRTTVRARPYVSPPAARSEPPSGRHASASEGVRLPGTGHALAGEGMAPAQGCPYDCGPCAFHANTCHLPVFSVTNVCNMACPICFTYNRPDRRYFMSRDELGRLLDRMLERTGPLDLLNLTGGEPTVHPEILSLLEECRRPEIGRVTMNSNGLRLAEDESLCRDLARLGVYVILSLSTLRPETSRVIHGRDVVAAKRRALENLQKFGVGTTLLAVMIRGTNDRQIGDILRLAQEHSVVRSVTVQTMTYTGQGGGCFGLGERPRLRMPLDGAARAIEAATGGQMRAAHFFPHPAAHPLCYSIAYYLKGDGRLRSFTDFFAPEELRDMLSGGYLLRPGARSADAFRAAIDRLWAEAADPDLLARFKELVRRLYPEGQRLTDFERQRMAEQDILTVYLHAHMDEDTLDLARLMVCPDQVPDAEGRLVPACAYNLFYRMKDERFWQERPGH